MTTILRQQSVEFLLQHHGCARISDHGGGIRHDIADKIWEYGFTSPGYQGHQKRTRTDDGSRVPDGLFDELMVNRSTGKMHG